MGSFCVKADAGDRTRERERERERERQRKPEERIRYVDT
jgi:hypothetical protein